jgi:hypothetical protein
MYLFFIRHFNDIDHLTPIAWRMKRDNLPVRVFCINPAYDLTSDYRINFLRANGIRVDYIYSAFDQGLGLRHRLYRFLFLRLFALHRFLAAFSRTPSIPLLGKLNNWAKEYGYRSYKSTRKRFYDVRWARNVMKQTGAKALCFDWIRPNKFVVKPLIEAGKEAGIPVISVPHGVFLYTNNYIKTGATEDMRFAKFNAFDYVVQQNPLRREVIARSGVPRERLVVLGSARYCDEWMSQNRKILPRKMGPENSRSPKLKVVLMTTRPKYRIHVDRMIKTFEMLSNLDDIEVVIKPHTRTGDEAYMYQNVPISEVSNYSSVELCEWADVILVVASSIIIEALKQGKPALYLKHLHKNTMEYEEFKACWIINSDAELKDALLALRHNKDKVPYAQENVDRWLAEIIYGGREKRDVLDDYEQFIVNLATPE